MTVLAPLTARATVQTRSRDVFVDAVRAFAILRVVAWHTLEWPALSYIAAMPVMFFVGGTLARPSFERRSVPMAVRQRLRRLLPPLWVYGVTAWALFLLTNAVGIGDVVSSPVQLLWWVVPLWDPTGPDAAVAWWAPLWYLRAYLWLVLLTPVLLRVLRSLGARTTAALLGVAATAVALATTSGTAIAAPFEDIAVYGLFWGLGMAKPELQKTFSGFTRRHAATIAAGFAAAGVAWMMLRPVPLGIVNASAMAEVLFGLAWIIGLSSCAVAIRRAASRDLLRRPIDVLNRRAVTIYLWHCGAIALSHELLDAVGLDGPWRWIPLSVLVVAATSAFVAAAGPIEDLTAPRGRRTRVPVSQRSHLRRVRSLAALATVPCVLLAAAVVPQLDLRDAEGAYVPASGRGLDKLISAEDTVEDDPIDPVAQSALGPVTDRELALLLDDWHEEWGLSGVVVAVGRSDGSGWSGAAGTVATDDTDEAAAETHMDAGQQIPAHSITKSFTGALLAQLHAEGRLDLDERLAVWMPEFPHAWAMTLRQMAQHSSGLADTGESPATAIQIAADRPLRFEPGTDTAYSDTAYFLLGTVIERATGMPYEQALRERLLEPLALDHTSLSIPERWSAGGITSTVDDLVKWSTIYWGGGLGEQAAREARTLHAENNFGVGTFGYCPCTGEGAAFEAELYGHLSAQGRLAWDPVDDLAVMIHTNEYNDGGYSITAWTDLDRRLRALTAFRPLPSKAAAVPASGS